MTKKAKTARGRKPLNLALQGGGAHGAFAWGVLDRLLQEDCFDIEGIVGTSAGAMNAAVTTYGLAKGGSAGAREALAQFWQNISKAGRNSPLQPSPLDRLMRPGNMDFSPLYHAFDALSKLMSPYQLNPMNLNPLSDVLAASVDEQAIRDCTTVKLFLCATNVLTGKHRVFVNSEFSVKAVLASACLPFLFQAVEIDGQYYWDGGYMGNPPIYPIIYNCTCRDVLIVQINPIKIPELPTTAQAIMDRINTLSFNSSLMREMRAIHFVTKLIDGGFNDSGRLKRMLIHTVDAEEEFAKYSVSSKLNPDWDFLQHLFAIGRRKGEEFLDQHYDKVGHETSADMDAKFL